MPSFAMLRVLIITLALFSVLAIPFYWQMSFGFDALDATWWRWLIKNIIAGNPVPAVIKYSTYAGLATLLTISLVSVIVLPRAQARTMGSKWSTKDLHGDARWATKKDIEKAGLFIQTGVIVGSWHKKLLRHDGPEHLLAFAPTRSGKGVSLVIPTLLEWQESVFVLDIKGENFEKTSGYREQCNQKVFRFEPTSDSSCSFNPLAEVRIDTPREIADVQNISATIIEDNKNTKNDYFTKKPRAFLTAVILFALHTKKAQNKVANMNDVCDLMAGNSDGENALESLLLDMMAFDNAQENVCRMIRSEAYELNEATDSAKGTRTGLLTTISAALTIFFDPLVARHTSKSDFMITDLMSGEQPHSLYFIVSPSDLLRLKPLIRILTTMLISRNTEKLSAYRYRLLLMLDEFPAIGNLELMENALAYIAGYGLKAYLIVQDLAQLKKLYSDSILSNCHVRIAFTPNEIQTANRLSELAGKTTVRIARRSRSQNLPLRGSVSDSVSEESRSLLLAQDAMQLPTLKVTDNNVTLGSTLIFVAGQPAIFGQQYPYFLDEEMLRKTKELRARGY